MYSCITAVCYVTSLGGLKVLATTSEGSPSITNSITFYHPGLNPGPADPSCFITSAPCARPPTIRRALPTTPLALSLVHRLEDELVFQHLTQIVFEKIDHKVEDSKKIVNLSIKCVEVVPAQYQITFLDEFNMLWLSFHGKEKT